MARSPYEFRIVRRAFFLLLFLIVLPSAGLSVFGVFAIKDERAVMTLRISRALEGAEQRITAALAAALDRAGRAAASDAPDSTPAAWLGNFRAEEPLCGRALLFDTKTHTFLLDEFSSGAASAAEGAASAADGSAPLHAPTAPLLQSAQTLAERGAGYFQMDAPPCDGTEDILATSLLQDGVLFVFQLNESALDRFLQEQKSEDTYATFVLRRAVNAGSQGQFFTMLAEMILTRRDAETSPIASRRLAPPLADFEVVALPTKQSESERLRTQVIYILSLVFFYIALIAGTVLVILALLHEARLSRIKTDFVSAVSHDLRTPMTSIRLFVETLAMGKTTEEETHECITMLLKETERLSAMIERLLEWSRIESGKKTYRMRPVQPSELVDEALAAFRTHNRMAGRQFDESKIALEISPNLPPVMADPSAISGVMLNLLENAQKYAGTEKGIAIRASLWKGRASDIVFSVTDHGQGIPKAIQKHIFEQFYRADDLLSRRTEGAGLGLASARRMVQMHKGKIWVESAPGEGSTFFFTLPTAPPQL